jgi:hypothetical protein
MSKSAICLVFQWSAGLQLRKALCYVSVFYIESCGWRDDRLFARFHVIYYPEFAISEMSALTLVEMVKSARHKAISVFVVQASQKVLYVRICKLKLQLWKLLCCI